ncbi:hypothetical protein HanIR_Chr16g0801981 [Helianthus annuus]|nr:hypothetical protein HanIR_Chr16g0801981 [Helianthus annuus]
MLQPHLRLTSEQICYFQSTVELQQSGNQPNHILEFMSVRLHIYIYIMFYLVPATEFVDRKTEQRR